ncbi:MAG: DUF1684 domain-containing protein [Candidatus Heimdallarchaeota archaeon]
MVIWLTFEEEILQHRAEFERFLKEGSDSPLTAEQKTDIKLQYFSPDEKYCVKANIEEFSKKRQKELVDKEGFPRKLIRFGKLRFEVEGIKCALEIFKDPDQEFFIAPFNDGTSGKETYGAGRFVEPSPAAKGAFIIDFNKAYNPYCAYNPQRSCPMPYARNRLPVVISSGEKTPAK